MMGSLTLSVSDTPVDGASHVVVAFSGVLLVTDKMGSDGMSMMHMGMMNMMGMGSMADSGSTVTLNFPSERMVDLLHYQDGSSAALLNGVQVPAGTYAGLFFEIDPSHSSITLTDGSVHPLQLPSGSSDRLSLPQVFEVSRSGTPAGGASLMVDFDLRQAVGLSAGNYTLNPTLRAVSYWEAGSISGSAANTLMIGSMSIADPSCSPAAYVYTGTHVKPVDINPSSSVQPVTTASLSLDTQTGDYRYTAAFLPPGIYTVALTCAALDNPATVDKLSFSNTDQVSVEGKAMPAQASFP